MLTLSARDRSRLVVLHQVQDRLLGVSEAARRLELSGRHMRRLLRRFEREGDAAVVHRGRGRRSNRALPDALRKRVLERAREPLFHDFGPTLLAEHLGRDPKIGELDPDTLRVWMIEAGLWQVERRRLRHRRKRERRLAFGELVLMDTSVHAWLEDRSSEEIVLIAMIDDATSALCARFVARDTGAANRQLLLDYISSHGCMAALYTDRASHFGNRSRRSSSRLALEEREAEQTNSIIRQALHALGSELIIALSPQAKGRVERLFRTLQDRLLKELRVAGVSSLAAANRFLEDVFIPWWEGRFTIPARDPLDAHRPLPQDIDVQQVFAERDSRVIGSDFTIRYQNERLQILAAEAEASMPKQKLVIERRLDGSTLFLWKGRGVTLKPAAPEPAAIDRRHLKRAGHSAPVPSNHPWRTQPFIVGRGVHKPPPVVASAPAALLPDTHGTSKGMKKKLLPSAV